MKKLLLFFTIIPFVLNAQYTKRELKQKEKWVDRLELRIVNRGVDFGETFVFYVERELSESTGEKIAEIIFNRTDDIDWDFVISEFENAMFLKGLDVGSYELKEIEKGSKNNSLKAGNLIVNGRYLFEFDSGLGNSRKSTMRKISVKDVENKLKVVATIVFRNIVSKVAVGRAGTFTLNQTILIEHIIEEFIKSGK
jgi:hypothetical protein